MFPECFVPKWAVLPQTKYMTRHQFCVGLTISFSTLEALNFSCWVGAQKVPFWKSKIIQSAWSWSWFRLKQGLKFILHNPSWLWQRTSNTYLTNVVIAIWALRCCVWCSIPTWTLEWYTWCTLSQISYFKLSARLLPLDFAQWYFEILDRKSKEKSYWLLFLLLSNTSFAASATST